MTQREAVRDNGSERQWERQSETMGALYVGCFGSLGQNQDGGQSDLYTLN